MTPTTMIVGGLLFINGALSVLVLVLLLAVHSGGKQGEEWRKKYEALLDPYRDTPK